MGRRPRAIVSSSFTHPECLIDGGDVITVLAPAAADPPAAVPAILELMADTPPRIHRVRRERGRHHARLSSERSWCNEGPLHVRSTRMRASTRLAIVSAVLVAAVPAITHAH